MQKRIAALDLGTNTFHLLIAELADGRFHRLVDEQRHVKLGEGGIEKGLIAEAAFSRGIEALKDFALLISRHEVETVKAVGTSALRSAKNGDEFIKSAKEAAGISIELIDGDKEAELIYLGAKAAVTISETCLIMDIGGGSVEFIICNSEQILWKKSYPIGAARLMAQFQHSDPISGEKLRSLRSYLHASLPDLKEKVQQFSPQMLIGTAGAFETFSALILRKYQRAGQTLEKYEFDVQELKDILQEIIHSDHQERETNPAIISVRVDMIVVAAALCLYVLSELQLPRITMSSFALKEGLVFESAAF